MRLINDHRIWGYAAALTAGMSLLASACSEETTTPATLPAATGGMIGAGGYGALVGGAVGAVGGAVGAVGGAVGAVGGAVGAVGGATGVATSAAASGGNTDTGSGGATDTGAGGATDTGAGGTTDTGAGGTTDTGAGGTTSAATTAPTVVCLPETAGLISDFAASGCQYGTWSPGALVTGVSDPWVNGASTASKACDGNLVLTLALAAGWDNMAGTGFYFMGHSDTPCTVVNAAAYSGFTLKGTSFTSAGTGATSVTLIVGANSGAGKTVTVTSTATDFAMSWADMGVTSASAITSIWISLVSVDTAATGTLTIGDFALTAP